MAQVKIENIIDRLDHDLKRALEEAVSSVVPDANFDRTALYRAFKRAVRRKCRTWENVNDHDVEKRCRHCGEKT